MVKILSVIILLAVLLCGCAGAESFETVADVYEPLESAEPASLDYLVPDKNAVKVFGTDGSRLYLCDGYEIAVETFSSGDLNQTVKELTGYARDSLTVMETGTSELARYECVWTAAGESGEQVGRTVILDDGKYHYCLSLTALEEEAGSLQQVWQEIMGSFAMKG